MVTTSQARQNVVFRAVADKTRRDILRLLRTGEQSVGEIAANFDQSRPAISKHLRVLRSAGLIVTHERGAARICELNAGPLRAIETWLRDYKAFWSDSMRNLKRYVEENR